MYTFHKTSWGEGGRERGTRFSEMKHRFIGFTPKYYHGERKSGKKSQEQNRRKSPKKTN